MSGRAWIDGYAVEQELTSRGESRAARGRRLADGVDVLLEVMMPSRSGPRDRIEARRSGALQHAARLQRLSLPGFAEVLECGPHGDGVWIATRWIDGTPLDRLLDGGPLAPDAASRMLIEIAEALDRLHDADVVHRALKAAHVICGPGGPVLTGLVALDSCAELLTGADPPWGTAQFAAPEQILGLGQTAASNRYAFALLAYRVLTAGLPFDTRSSIDFLYATLYAKPAPIRRWRAELPGSLDALFLRALAHEPADRPDRCIEIATSIRDALTEEATARATRQRLATDALRQAWQRERPVGGPAAVVAQPPDERARAPQPEAPQPLSSESPPSLSPELPQPPSPESPPPVALPQVRGLPRARASSSRKAAPATGEELADRLELRQLPPARPPTSVSGTVPPPRDPRPQRRDGLLGVLRAWLGRLGAPRGAPRDAVQREAYLADWRTDVARSRPAAAQLPVWRLRVEVERPGCTVRVDGEDRGTPPLDIELRGRAGSVVKLEVRDEAGRLLAADAMRLHPLMNSAWKPEIGAALLPFKREA